MLMPMQVRGSPAAHKSNTPIRIGVVVPLTGPDAVSQQGLYELSGARLAVREINGHGGVHGHPLRVVLADDQSTPAGAVAAFEQLVKGSPSAIIATASSQRNQAMSPSFKTAGIPVIIGPGAATLNHEGDPWVFATWPNSIYSTRALSAFTVSTLHQSRIAVLYDNAIATTVGNAQLLAGLKARGVTPVVDQVIPASASDLAAQVLAIKKAGARALITLTTGIDVLLLLARQMQQEGVHLTWLGNLNLGDEKLVREGGALLFGTYTVTPYAPDQSPEALAFNRRSEATLHLSGSFVSAYSYDGVQILAKVMRKVGTNRRAIRRGILAIRGYRGVMGTYNFDKHGEGLRQETVVQNVNGTLRVIKVLRF